jgi:trimeric autotransporter adhesin
MNSFKKLALGIAAALSFATLSAMPSQAAVNADTISIDTAADAVFTGESATAVVTVSFLAQTTSDTVTVTSSVTSLPVGSASLATLSVQETSSAAVVLGSGNYSANIASTANTATYVTAKIKATVDAPSIAGTYVYKFTPSLGTGSTGGVNSAAVVWTVTVTAPDTKASAGTSTSILNKGETISATADVEVFAPKATASDAVAVIAITQKNAAGASASESMTAIVSGSGLIGTGSNHATITAQGRALTVANGQYIGIFADNTSGVGTVTITSASGVVLAVEKVTFYGDIATVVTTTAKPVIATGSNADVVTAVAYDAAGVTVGAGTLYAVSDSASVVSNSYTSATIVDGVAKFALTGVASGTAGIKVSTGSTATTTGAVVSNTAPVRVEGSVASVKVAFDKSTYAAGELATITVTPTDAKGLVLSGKTFANLFATGGLVSSYAFGASSDSLTAVSVTTDANGIKTYKVYMPLTDVAIKVTATGGTSLPTAAQVEVSTTASVVTGSSMTNATLAALIAQVNAMQVMFDSIKAEAAAAKAAADAKAIADRAAFVKQYNALATKWNKKNPKAKVALLKK